MTIEARQSLLGSVAIICNGQNCTAEHIGMSEQHVIASALSYGWKGDMKTAAQCPECATGLSPKQRIEKLMEESKHFQEGRQQNAQNQPSHQPPAMMPALAAMMKAGDDEEDEEDVYDEPLPGEDNASIQPGERLVDTSMLAKEMEDEDIMLTHMKKRKKEQEAKEFVPFEKRSGATIPGVTETAHEETPEEEGRREVILERLEARRQKQRKEARANQSQKTLEKMGGVEDLLADFNGMFGNQSDPDKW